MLRVLGCMGGTERERESEINAYLDKTTETSVLSVARQSEMQPDDWDQKEQKTIKKPRHPWPWELHV